MTVLVSGTPDYTMGFSEEYLQALRRFSAESHAGHLLPYLRPGLRVLDFGCGPGAISAGLATAIAPGELHGVDVEESQVALARAVARAGKHANAIFHVADVTDLPFEDGFFDAAHGHSILTHVPDTHAALAEVKRVLKPGGILSCREMICESSFTYPDFGVIRNSWDMFEDLLVADDGHPQMGKEIKGHLVQAEFENIRVSASFSAYSTPEDIAFIYGLANQWFLSPEITEAAIKYGASTEELCNDIRASYDKWKRHPGAFCAIAYGEAIADKPLY
ncbi:MAG: methyltransferase domain-containing protein [Chloroflexi bacterium]|nr:methyltransferase domain-containing protein [Chloroflexota bacterium]